MLGISSESHFEQFGGSGMGPLHIYSWRMQNYYSQSVYSVLKLHVTSLLLVLFFFQCMLKFLTLIHMHIKL